MKIFATVLALLASSASATQESQLKIHASKSTSDHHVEERAMHQEVLAKKQDMFDRIAHMKSTPWDSQPEERESKCEDLCLLSEFWEVQEGRNCYNRATSLCSVYKNGLASMEVVLTVAECACNSSTSASSQSV